jgi:hypothetical protein
VSGSVAAVGPVKIIVLDDRAAALVIALGEMIPALGATTLVPVTDKSRLIATLAQHPDVEGILADASMPVPGDTFPVIVAARGAGFAGWIVAISSEPALRAEMMGLGCVGQADRFDYDRLSEIIMREVAGRAASPAFPDTD